MFTPTFLKTKGTHTHKGVHTHVEVIVKEKGVHTKPFTPTLTTGKDSLGKPVGKPVIVFWHIHRSGHPENDLRRISM